MDVKKMYLLVVFWISSITFVRIIFTLHSGFILPDEGMYLYLSNGKFVMGGRFVFQLFFILLFKVFFFIHSVFGRFILFMIVNYLFLLGSVFLLKKILERVVKNDYAIVATIFLMMTTISWCVVNFTALTEPFAFFFFLLGLYFVVSDFNSYKSILTSGMCFGIASSTRIFYTLFFLNVILIMIDKNLNITERLKRSVLFSFPVIFFVDVPYGLFSSLFSHTVERVGDFASGASLTAHVLPHSLGLSIFDRLYISFVNSLIGFFVGWGILLFFICICSLRYWREITSVEEKKVFINSIISIVGIWLLFFIIAGHMANIKEYFSTTVRFTSMSLFGVVLTVKEFNKMTFKRVVVVVCAVFLSTVMLVSMTIVHLQSNLSVKDFNRLNVNYESNAYKVYLYLSDKDKDDIVVFGDPICILRLYLDEKDIRCYTVDLLDKDFIDTLLKNDKKVYLYGELYEFYLPLLEEYSRFAYDIVMGNSDYKMIVVWWTDEGYFIEVYK